MLCTSAIIFKKSEDNSKRDNNWSHSQPIYIIIRAPELSPDKSTEIRACNNVRVYLVPKNRRSQRRVCS